MKDIVEIELNERKLTIALIISDMRANTFVSSLITTAIEFFKYTSEELDIWKYANENSYFQSKITNELNNDTGGFKAFLQTIINQDGITIYQYLMSKII